MTGILRIARLSKAGLSCEIELIQAPGRTDGYLVNLREGKAGQEWRESSKTPFALELIHARRIFQETLESKLNQAYQLESDSAPELASVTAAPNSSKAATTTNHSLTEPALLVSTHPKPTSTTDQATAILLQRLPAAVWKKLSASEQSRTIWNLGLRRNSSAAARLVELLESGNEMLDYALAFALGRSADKGATLALFELSQRHTSAMVQRMARHAWLMLADQGAREFHGQQLLARWPNQIQSIFQQVQPGKDFTHLHTALDKIIQQLDIQAEQKNPHALDWRRDLWLEQVYEYAVAATESSNFAREFLLHACRHWSFDSLIFRAYRHLFKLAELRDDYELFALLLHRFERTPAHYWLSYGSDSQLYIRGKWRRYSDEVKRADSGVAYSNLTRDYLLRRGWRSLQQLAENQPEHYLNYALAYLRLCDDGHASAARTRHLSYWDNQSRRYQTISRHYDGYAGWHTFNQLTRSRGPWQINRNGRKATIEGEQAHQLTLAQRYEAHPEIWDQAPTALYELALHQNCQGVADFAAAALAPQSRYCGSLDALQLSALLRARWPLTQQLGLAVLQQRLQQRPLSEAELLALLASSLPAAAQLALQTLRANQSVYAQHSAVLLALFGNPEPTLAKLFGELLALSQPEVRQQMLLSLLAQLGHAQFDELQLQAMLAYDAGFWRTHLQAPLAQLSLAEFSACASQLKSARLFAAQLAALLLSLHPQGLQLIDSQDLYDLLQHPEPEWQAVGSQLFSAYPPEVLRQHADLLALLACSEMPRIRQQIHPLLQQFADDLALQQRVLSEIIDHLFRTDVTLNLDQQRASLHSDLLQLAKTSLHAACRLLESDLQWRLLQAKSRGAQQFGAWLLTQPDSLLAQQLSLTQWLQLARHPQHSVRQRLQQYCLSQSETLLAQRSTSLALFDSKWPDMLEFAAEFFLRRVALPDWQLAELVQLCDHPQAAVQRFGRQLIMQRFNAAEAAEFVSHLAEHPSAAMQLFVSQWLEQAILEASDSKAMLQQLRPYFLTVLSHVNKARTVKNRIIDFLSRYALQQVDAAEFVADLFSRQVVTVTLQDKAAYLLGLRALLAHYPQLQQRSDWPISLIAVAEKAGTSATRELSA